MTIKQWMQRAWEIDKNINALKQEVENEKTRIMRVTAQYNDIKVQTAKQNSKENAIIKYINYNEKLEQQINELYTVKQEIFDAISKLENASYRTLLTLRYLQFMTWERIAQNMELKDVRWIYVMHNRALQAVSKIISCSDKL